MGSIVQSTKDILSHALQVEFVAELIKNAGVTAVPGHGFFHVESNSTNVKDPSPSCNNYQKRYIRFAFCKSNATLSAAAQKMSLWMGKAVSSSLDFVLRGSGLSGGSFPSN